ncbi:hypothetical protein E3N88_38025 [Mikania micrantha]|uniref:Protein FAR1-RELATED SEQUENCE n=1 Tax=Mikania micrantha TaxID=192012 RepID=A0A5N6LSS7_9ASTR|nr:hypothetical protein E3N88_38025 [Mikania micrantha]
MVPSTSTLWASKVFAGPDELVECAIARGLENDCVSSTGVYKGEPKLRRAGSKKTGCEFELIGKYERSCDGWKLRVVNSEHNHQGAEQLDSHSYAMRLNEAETRLVEQLSNQNILPRDILAAVKDQNPDNVSNLRSIYNARRKLRAGQNMGETPMQEEDIKESFERSIIFRMAHHNDDQFELLKENVSHVALVLLVGEKAKIRMLITSNSSCGCHLFTSCGLPCACRLSNNAKITLDKIDVFWRKLDLNPSLLNEDENVDIDVQMDRVIQHIKNQPNPVKKRPGFAPQRYWMQMSQTGVLIANAFGVIVICITINVSATIFPLWTSAEYHLPHRVVSFVFVNDNHFVMVELNGDYSIPPPSGIGQHTKTNAPLAGRCGISLVLMRVGLGWKTIEIQRVM